MHHKVDQIATHLGIALYHLDMERKIVGGSNRCVVSRSIDNTGVASPMCDTSLAQLGDFPLHDRRSGLGKQVMPCWLWSLIFQIQRYYLDVIVTQEYCTLIPPALGFPPRKFCGICVGQQFCGPMVLG